MLATSIVFSQYIRNAVGMECPAAVRYLLLVMALAVSAGHDRCGDHAALAGVHGAHRSVTLAACHRFHAGR